MNGMTKDEGQRPNSTGRKNRKALFVAVRFAVVVVAAIAAEMVGAPFSGAQWVVLTFALTCAELIGTYDGGGL